MSEEILAKIFSKIEPAQAVRESIISSLERELNDWLLQEGIKRENFVYSTSVVFSPDKIIGNTKYYRCTMVIFYSFAGSKEGKPDRKNKGR